MTIRVIRPITKGTSSVVYINVPSNTIWGLNTLCIRLVMDIKIVTYAKLTKV